MLIEVESIAVPADHNLGLKYQQRDLPVRPTSDEGDPVCPVGKFKARAGALLRVIRELLSKCQLHGGLFALRPRQCREGPR